MRGASLDDKKDRTGCPDRDVPMNWLQIPYPTRSRRPDDDGRTHFELEDLNDTLREQGFTVDARRVRASTSKARRVPATLAGLDALFLGHSAASSLYLHEPYQESVVGFRHVSDKPNARSAGESQVTVVGSPHHLGIKAIPKPGAERGSEFGEGRGLV